MISPKRRDYFTKDLTTTLKKIPIVVALGNYEYTAGQTEQEARLFVDAGFFSSC